MKTSALIPTDHSNPVFEKILLTCGILSSCWYVAINIYVPLRYKGYSLSSLTISELSALGSPTRTLWLLAVIPYLILFAAFGWGLLKTSQQKSPLRKIGALILAYCFFNGYWPPMHARGEEPTLTDTLHIVWAAVTVILMLVIMALGAKAFGKAFRWYTILSILFLIVFGALTSLEAPNIPVNKPTPMIGVWERINIGIYLCWIAALSAGALRTVKRPSRD
ncbi:DUF998 domain-containing protein [Chryseolinea lacunae]|uniref:DUF998 domain-containing protein n=1 Tax=Chryseolinea lacunae TaxID=2801331 RepID=A0ABS1KUX4_9BACT|nr:DUF998 domain-containing protein [Chryseolinea lacunae]MBL0743022.1 DUF998 domain-containing protein [Chryseolinea lacunae]